MKSLSLDSTGRFVLAVSSRDCVLWDLDTFTRFRTLNGGQEVGIQDVSTIYMYFLSKLCKRPPPICCGAPVYYMLRWLLRVSVHPHLLWFGGAPVYYMLRWLLCVSSHPRV